MLLATIAYENSLLADSPPDTADPLQPIPIPSPSDELAFGSAKVVDDSESPYVLEVRWRPILHRLRSPVPVVQARSAAEQDLLPLPNVVPWQRLIRRARASAQEGVTQEAQEREGETAGNSNERRIPGALDTEEGA